MTTAYEMPVVDQLPPMHKGRPVRDSELVSARREQLLATPNKWLLWDGQAPRFQEINKILIRLMALPAATKMSRKEWHFKGATRKNSDGSYSLYVGYFPQAFVEEVK
jgi:hypothetical protein